MKNTRLLLIILLLTLPTIASAQKGGDRPTGIFDTGAEYDEFMGSVKRAAYGEGGSPELRAMVPMLNDLALGQELGTTARQYGTAENTEFDLLADEKIRGEIGMVDEQYDELRKMNQQIQQRAAADLRKLDFSDRDGLVDRLREIRDRSNKELESLFIPEQLERLQQLRTRSRLRRGSLVDLLTTDPLKDRLEITDQQAESLRETEAELEKEIQKEIARLREDARKRLLDNLNSEQQEQVEELLGDPFEFQPRPETRKGRGSKKLPSKGK
jgi:mRNA-degrading endonuclease RelE of RelBE toxin-antitoxin system